MEDGLFPSKRSIDEDESVEEERRLCYVGITRAKEQLFLTNASKRTLYGSTTFTMPSRFLDEIPQELFDDSSINNINLRKRKSESYLNKEYADVEGILAHTGGKFSAIEPKAKSSGFGLSVDSFLKNMNISGNKVAAASSNNNKYDVGMTVKHKKFGVGVITKIEPEGNDFKLDISFQNSGNKRLMAAYTPLEIL